jgi:hypothetical protein
VLVPVPVVRLLGAPHLAIRARATAVNHQAVAPPVPALLSVLPGRMHTRTHTKIR